MSAPAPRGSVRVREARTESVCPLCGRLIKVGDQVAAASFTRWAHTACVTAERRKQATAGTA